MKSKLSLDTQLTRHDDVGWNLNLWVIPYEINQEKAKNENVLDPPSDFDKIWHTCGDYCEFKIYVKF